MTGRERRALRRDAALVERLRAGDRAAFSAVVTDYSPMMRHVARGYVASPAAADDVVQEAWLTVIRSLETFEGRSALRTWIVGIVVNIARRHGTKDARTVPWSAVAADGVGTVDPARFQGGDAPNPGAWTSIGAPSHWAPERRALDAEALRLLRSRVGDIAGVPAAGRNVARRGRTHRRGGVRCARLDGRQPAHPAAPGPGTAPPGTGGLLPGERGEAMTDEEELRCQQVVELVTDYLEGALDADLTARFREHLRGCPHCTEYLDRSGAPSARSGTFRWMPCRRRPWPACSPSSATCGPSSPTPRRGLFRRG